MRAARWFRESTAGQWDNFGPDAQREQQDRAIARYGLADSGLEWSVASSGWTSAWRTPDLGGDARLGAGRRVRRPRRRLREPLPAQPQADPDRGRGSPSRGRRRGPVRRRAAAHRPDPTTGTSSSGRPTRPRPTAASSRKRVGEGYAAKRRRLGVPGGNRAPYGIIREGKPSTLRIDEAKAATVRRAYELAAVGADRLGGGRRHRPRQDPRRRAAHEPDLRRPPAHRRARRPRTDRRARSLVQGAVDARSCAEPGRRDGSSSATTRSACAVRAAAVPLRRHRALPPPGADLRGVHRRDA